MFAALAGDCQIADERLQRFQQRRTATLQALGQVPPEELLAARDESTYRATDEAQGQTSKASMALLGVLPL
jgi:hypothetical protein